MLFIEPQCNVTHRSISGYITSFHYLKLHPFYWWNKFLKDNAIIVVSIMIITIDFIITIMIYCQTSNISCIGNTIVDHSDVVGASPVSAAPTTSSFST